jgi:hypothetical protein
MTSKGKPGRDGPGQRGPVPGATGERQDGQPIVPDRAAGRAAPAAPPNSTVPAAATSAEVADFVAKMQALAPRTAGGNGRLVFAMDATMSRQPTWDMALALQGDMFDAVKTVGGLDVQLVYFRGHGECRASKWVSEPAAVKRLMTTVACQGGYTQIGKVLTHALKETEVRKVHALVYVGDAMEEDVDALCHRAGELGIVGVPVFLFQEGREPRAEAAFREIARLSKGAWCPFNQGSAAELRALLSAVAVYAAGGRKALEALSHAAHGKGARLLLEQIKPGGR